MYDLDSPHSKIVGKARVPLSNLLTGLRHAQDALEQKVADESDESPLANHARAFSNGNQLVWLPRRKVPFHSQQSTDNSEAEENTTPTHSLSWVRLKASLEVDQVSKVFAKDDAKLASHKIETVERDIAPNCLVDSTPISTFHPEPVATSSQEFQTDESPHKEEVPEQIEISSINPNLRPVEGLKSNQPDAVPGAIHDGTYVRFLVEKAVRLQGTALESATFAEEGNFLYVTYNIGEYLRQSKDTAQQIRHRDPSTR